MKKVAFLVMIITVLSKILGFGRELVLSYTYGASAITDAYLVSQTIPAVIFGFISAGITTGFIPMYSRVFNEQGPRGAIRYTNNLSNSLILLASIIVAFVLLFTQPIVKLFASGFTGDTVELAMRFTRINVFGVYFTALANIFAGYLRIHGNYIVPALVGFPMNLIIISSLLISSRTNTDVIVIGTVLANASQLLLLIPAIRKTGYRWQPILNMKDETIKMMVMLALPVIMGTSVNEINVVVDRSLASSIAVGGISALSYAKRLNGFVQGVFVASITTVMYPMISKMAAEKDITGVKRYVSEAISIISLFVIPATIGIVVFSKQITSLLFGRGAFTSEAIEMTSTALCYYSIGMIAYGLRNILSRAFYALQDTKTPMINATIAVVLNIALNLVLSRYMGIGGLALATSISAIVSTFLMLIALRKKVGGLGLKKTTTSLVKISVASVLMGSIALWSLNLFDQTLRESSVLILAVTVGVLAYAVLIYFMKVPEVTRMLKAIETRAKRQVAKGKNLGSSDD